MTTERRRWKVWRDNTLANNWINPWVAAAGNPSDYGYAGKFFPTHAEALAYADRMARTVGATLPRVTDDCEPIPNSPKPPQKSIWYGHRKGGAYWLASPTTPDETLIVPQDSLAPLALTLLALHYRNETP